MVAGLNFRLPISYLKRSAILRRQHQADAARDRKDWPAAARGYRSALDLDGRRWGLWVQYGHALKESGRLDQAEDAYRQALEIAPNVADTHLQVGHVLKLKNDKPGASAAYLRAAVLDPKSPHPTQELRSFGWSKEEVLDFADPVAGRTLKRAEASRPEATRALLDPRVPFDADAYAQRFADVRELLSLSLIDSAEQHYLHYGYREGRDILATFFDTPPSRIFVLCPSFFKRCGIGEHARYLADCLENAGLETHRVRTTSALDAFRPDQLRNSVVLVNHGPGLFDGYNPELSEGEATTDVISKLLALYRAHNARPIVFMHSLLDRDNAVMFPRQQFWLESPIPVVTTIESASNVFNIWRVEHGMQPAPAPATTPVAERPRDYPTIGFFGFFQWGGKNFDALLDVVQRLKGKLVGSVATANPKDVAKLKGLIAARGIRCDLGTGWVDDSELMRRLAEADFFYLPQHDYDHWNNSGTARLVMNFRRPVLLPPYNPFLDLREYAVFADEQDLPALMAWMRDDAVYASASARAADYAEKHPMTREMPRMATSLHKVACATGARNFIDQQAFTAWALLGLSDAALKARIALRAGEAAANAMATSEPDSVERVAEINALRESRPGVVSAPYPVVPPVQYWRDHYDIDSFFMPTLVEAFVHAHRRLLKREPNLMDRKKVGALLRADLTDANAPATADKILALLATLVDHAPTIDFAPRVQIYDRGAPLDKADLTAPETARLLARRWTARCESCESVARKTPTEPHFSPTHDRNILQLLLLPDAWVEAALHASAKAAGFEVSFRGVGGQAGPFARYQSLTRALEAANVRVTEIGLVDRAVVTPIDSARLVYSVGDFWPFEGDAFLFQAIRCLCKRDPFPQELFEFSETFSAGGKLAVLRQLAGRKTLAATIIDLEDEPYVVSLDAAVAKYAVLVEQFRSVYAGGWALRNFYLESRRDYDRTWLRLKGLKDIWWTQSQGDLKTILREDRVH